MKPLRWLVAGLLWILAVLVGLVGVLLSVTVLLLDEPTSGLDPKAANNHSILIRGLSEKGAAVLMATHDLFRVKEVGHRVGIMRQGKLVASLRTADVDHAELEEIYLEHMQR